MGAVTPDCTRGHEAGNDLGNPMGEGNDLATTIGRLVLVVIPYAGGMFVAWWLVNAFRAWRRRAGDKARDLMGTSNPPPWMTGDWACGRCHTVNRHARDQCQGCRARRSDVQMTFEPPPAEPDAIPDNAFVGPGGVCMLEHNGAAHAERLNGHWRLRINGVVTGTAAMRDGAAALLRAVEGTELILFDPHESGPAVYRVDALIAAFEHGRLPFNGTCPEHSGSRLMVEAIRNPPPPPEQQPRNVTPRG